jgi:RNA polymerase sigma factor (TIGR02999 family)
MDVTGLLLEWSKGDQKALDQLAPLLYEELVRIARFRLSGESSRITLEPTALVHEAYLKLMDQTRLSWQNRAHFLAIAANVMRRVLIDNARKRNSEKRGGGLNITLHEELDAGAEKAPDVLALDLALEALAQVDERKSRIIELKYFGGLTAEEISEVLDISIATIGRELRLAHAWLRRELEAAS